MGRGEQKIVKYLREALSTELALITTLNSHVQVAEGQYRRLLKRHIRETQSHADQVQQRLAELGAPQKSPVQTLMGLVQSALGQGLVLVKGPVDMVRGQSAQEKMLHNARDEAMTEIMEIATYDALEHLALSLGDAATAELAARIRRDEEAMLAALREQIPTLTAALLQTEVPAEERTVVLLDEPWAGYDQQTVEVIIARLSDASEELRRRVREYGVNHKNRKSVIDATKRTSAPA